MAKQQKSEPVAQPAAEEVVEEQSGPLDAAAKKGWKIANLKTKPKVLIGICSPLIFLAILGGVSGYSINTIVETNKWVDHTREVLAESAAIIGSAVDMETGMRGYLLAGQDGFLDPYRSGEQATYEQIAVLKETVNDNPAQVARLAEVEQVLREWQEKVTEPTIALRREIGDAETMNDMAALVGEARGKVYFDRFRGQIATFIGREASLLTERRGEFQSAQGAVSDNFGLVQDTTGWVDHTHEVLAAAARLLADAVDMETGMRGYLLAGEESFLDPYKPARRPSSRACRPCRRRSTTTRRRSSGCRRRRPLSGTGSSR